MLNWFIFYLFSVKLEKNLNKCVTGFFIQNICTVRYREVFFLGGRQDLWEKMEICRGEILSVRERGCKSLIKQKKIIQYNMKAMEILKKNLVVIYYVGEGGGDKSRPSVLNRFSCNAEHIDRDFIVSTRVTLRRLRLVSRRLYPSKKKTVQRIDHKFIKSLIPETWVASEKGNEITFE